MSGILLSESTGQHNVGQGSSHRRQSRVELVSGARRHIGGGCSPPADGCEGDTECRDTCPTISTSASSCRRCTAVSCQAGSVHISQTSVKIAFFFECQQTHTSHAPRHDGAATALMQGRRPHSRAVQQRSDQRRYRWPPTKCAAGCAARKTASVV